MPIHHAPLIQTDQLVPGDILIEYENSPEHSLMWLGGGKPIVHSAEATFSGILRQSARGFGGQGTPCFEVYRSLNNALGAKVSQFAAIWATSSNDARYIFAKNNLDELSLMTRFSQDRLGGDGGHWDNEARVRAVRAYCRVINNQPLSAIEGVTCSQFITYTYQAASIALLVARHALTRVVIQEINSRLLLNQLHNAMAYAAATASLRSIRLGIDATMPDAFKVDAKITSVDVLAAKLRLDPRFGHVGNLAGGDEDSD
ncbi:hypothetical protein [Fibrella forsythiae]|uniref:Uncharacterized protein n=1 Tax=Fibrella forsythiae TaxID=2817061 RepID=A0ABS3JCG0_9BACT|nr:hypothetical protein [Fibrella forsythiae]MBO0947128.1 hypothetical protein [Fibrella forsythiae]